MRLPTVLCWCTALLTLALLTMGGVVHATGSSLACPDWPLCHGQAFPPMRGGVAFEHTHRLLGAGVGVLTLSVVIAGWRRDRAIRRAGLAAVALLLVQATLGGVTVLAGISRVASTLHLLLGTSFLALVVFLGTAPGAEDRPGPRRWTAAAAVVVLAQIVLGGLVRHLGAGMACGTDPVLCAGALVPSWPGGQLQVAHRLGALAVAAVVLVTAARVRTAAADRPARRLAAGAAALVLVQIGLGVLSVTTSLGVAAVAAHLAAGALLLATLVAAHRRLGRGEARRPSDFLGPTVRELP